MLPNRFLTKLAGRFVAGIETEEALDVVHELRCKNIFSTLDILGEDVTDRAGSERQTNDYCQLIRDMYHARARVEDANVSLKLTMFGLAISPDLCYQNIVRILRTAKSCGNMFVRIDMEGSVHTDRSLALFHRLFKDFDNVGIVVQAYLKRTEADVIKLLEAGAQIRLCKGAYKESAAIALQRTRDIRENYLICAQHMFKSGGYHAFATHDKKLLAQLLELAESCGCLKDNFELQMLYGMRRDAWFAYTRAGYRFRVYVPYGPDWLPYFVRRLQERKENVFFVLSHLFH